MRFFGGRLVRLCSLLLVIPLVGLLVFLNIPQPRKHLFVSSAYFVQNAETGTAPNAVRLLVLAENDIIGLNLLCIAHGGKSRPLIMHMGGPGVCRWATYLMDCSVGPRPQRIALTSSSDEKIRHELNVAVPDPTKRSLVVCFSRMVFYERWRTALTILSLYQLFGADLMVIPVASVIRPLHTIIKAMETEGKIRLKAAVKIPQMPDLGYDPNNEVEWFNQVTSYTECLYDHRDSADFVVHADMDDIIMPRHFPDLPSEFLYWSRFYPDAASIEFRWSSVITRGEISPQDFKMEPLMRSAFIAETVNYGKSVVRPRRISQSFVHHPTENRELLDGYEHIVLDTEAPMAIHLRSIHLNDESIPPTNAYFTNNSQLSSLDSNFRSFLERNPEAKTAFLALPLRDHYYEEMHDCYLDLGQRIGKGTLLQCPNPLNCSPKRRDGSPECIVLSNEFASTFLSDDLHIYSTKSSQFLLRNDCFLNE